MRNFILISQAGCILPVLIVFNLFFGLFFFKPLYWILFEGVLIVLFILNSVIFTRKMFSGTANNAKKRPGAIDVEGEVIEDKKQLKRD